MTSWTDVETVASRLAGAAPAPDGEPAYVVGRHPFVRLHVDETGREIVQLWTFDPPEMYADRSVFCRVDAFRVKASLWAYLDRLDGDELAELVTDSWRARRGVR